METVLWYPNQLTVTAHCPLLATHDGSLSTKPTTTIDNTLNHNYTSLLEYVRATTKNKKQKKRVESHCSGDGYSVRK